MSQFTTFMVTILFLTSCAQNSSAIKMERPTDKETSMKLCSKLPQTEESIVRLAKLEIYPEYLEEYKAAAREIGEISLRDEPGVLTMYAVAEAENPTRITILEIYADAAAYRAHLQTEHFKKYKTGTMAMIKSLELIDTKPLNSSIYLMSVAQ